MTVYYCRTLTAGLEAAEDLAAVVSAILLGLIQ